MGFGNQISGIKGISERRRLPRLGKIRLGVKIKGKSRSTGRDVEYPAELPFFLLPDGPVAKACGGTGTVERAKELGVTREIVLRFIAANQARLAEEIEIMLPINDPGAVFPHAYKFYGSSKGVKCMGNGEIARYFDEDKKAMLDRDCPCGRLKSEANPQGECTARGHLMCLIPKVSLGGIYQIDVGSYHSIVDVNSGIDYVTALVGRFALVPLSLRRVPRETHHGGQKQIHYTIQLTPHHSLNVVTLDKLRRDTARILAHSQYALPPAEDVNPVLDSDAAATIIEPEVEEEGDRT